MTGLLSGKYKQQSIFSLFNKVITSGAEKLLDFMFKNPLDDPETINRRSAIFQYFRGRQLSFPFTNEQFSAVENYLNGTNNTNYASSLISLARKKLLGTLIRDEEYGKIQHGLQHCLLSRIPKTATLPLTEKSAK